ncbi:MAG: M15 family metallopeptidase [Lachnospiraceae bacterium]|nr:M15 family metallopeptidase [Lachnospiraceae bacterium]
MEPETDQNMSTENLQNLTGNAESAPLTGYSLNGELMADARITWENGFYYEPLSEALVEYITGVSYPESLDTPAITTDELTYVHVLYYDFEGNPAEGELICNQAIAQDLVEIFCELYKTEYQIEKIRLIDEYGGDDNLSMADNNTSCFNYRVVEGTSSLSRHAYGLAVDINPLYNPYITYNKDQTINVSPAAGEAYADRSTSFPYKIDENDLCYRLFKEHGFTWGGDWNSCKDYQHFQKTP